MYEIVCDHSRLSDTIFILILLCCKCHMIGLGHQRFPGVRRTEGQDQGGEKTLQRNRELLQTEVNSEPYPQVSVSLSIHSRLWQSGGVWFRCPSSVCFHLICLPQIYRQTRKFIAVLYHEKTVWFISYIRWITFTVFRVYLIRKDLIIIICIISLLRKKFFIIDRFRSLINDLSKFGVIDLHQGSNNSSLFSTYWEPFSLRLDNCLDL